MWLPSFISRVWGGELSGFEVQRGTSAAALLVGMLGGQGIPPSAFSQGLHSPLLSVTPLTPCRAREAGKLGLGLRLCELGCGP